jgi:hypothetical protein
VRWPILIIAAPFVFGSAVVPAAKPEKVRLQNAMASCVAVEFRETVSYENLLLLPAVLHSRRLTAECGCKSALLAYRVTEGATGDEVSAGEWLDPGVSKPQSPFLFVLESDRRARPVGALTLHLGCGPP